MSDYAAGCLDNFRRSAMIGRKDFMKAVRIKALGQRHRAHKVAEQYAKLAVLDGKVWRR